MVEVQQPTVLDTGKQQLAAVYAKALLGATEKSATSETALEELESLVHDVLERMPRLEAVLSSPRVPLEAKLRMLDTAFGGRMAPQLLNFLKVLVRRGRFDCLRAIAWAARQHYNQLRGRVRVQLQSAEPLEQAALDDTTNRLRAALGRDVDLHLSVNSELIGGLVIRIGDTVYDGSLRNRLKRLKSNLLTRAGQRFRQASDKFAGG